MVYKRITNLITKNNVIAIDKLKFLCYNVDIINNKGNKMFTEILLCSIVTLPLVFVLYENNLKK